MADTSVDSLVCDPPYGISFMGKKWDYDVPGVEVWRECLRVLKPGGHILVACGTRTQHRMCVNIEDGGFEIRDLVAWVYGSGFPKSLNVGKSIDKKQGTERKVVGNGKPMKSLGVMHDDEWESDCEYKETKGTSEYEGWGTALKPAMELWTLARKPLGEKNIAENCLKWGTGGLNIDGCRVETHQNDNWYNSNYPHKTNGYDASGYKIDYKRDTMSNTQGRFPANLIHDGSDEVVGMFPETKSGKAEIGTGKGYAENASGIASTGKIVSCFADSGSASRFFYCAKASKSERNAGLDGFDDTVKFTQMRSSNGTGDKNFEGGFQDQIMKNGHPTVKPISLMRYLCRLITPKGGIVLDPFMGSGSTGCGAVLEGFSFIGIEKEEEYIKIAEARIRHWQGTVVVEEAVKQNVPVQLSMF
jgi:DNA modification methylase